MPASIHEQLARETKAAKLALCLQRWMADAKASGTIVTVDSLRHCGEEFWTVAASQQYANVNIPSPATRARVIELLQEAETRTKC